MLCLAVPASGLSQASPGSRAEILRRLIAEESSARIEMPFGGEGVELSDLGVINDAKLRKELQKNGTSIMTGRIVKITDFEFNSNSIDIELDGGGKAKKNIGSHVQISVGNNVPQAQQTGPATPAPKIRGSKISLVFQKKVPENLTADDLKLMLAPVLDFSKHTTGAGSIESLPPEFQEAVLAKEARIGMDEDTVLLAMGRPDRKSFQKVAGVEQEDWIYNGRGIKKTYVTFESSVVVRITINGQE